MTRVPVGSYGSGTKVKVGDTVHIRATVVATPRSEEVVVELFSQTENYICPVRADLVEVEVPDVDDEPEDGAWIHSIPDEDEKSSVFRRDDLQAPIEDGRRHQRCWWDYAAGEWVDWATAKARGATPNRRLYTEPPTASATGHEHHAVVTPTVLVAVRRWLNTFTSGTSDEICAGVNGMLRQDDRTITVTNAQVEAALRLLRREGHARAVDVIGGIVGRWVRSSPPD